MKTLLKNLSELVDLLWKPILLILFILFLMIFYNFSQNGRYIPLNNSPLLDTRTGLAYYPYGSFGEKKLVPVLDPEFTIRRQKAFQESPPISDIIK